MKTLSTTQVQAVRRPKPPYDQPEYQPVPIGKSGVAVHVHALEHALTGYSKGEPVRRNLAIRRQQRWVSINGTLSPQALARLAFEAGVKVAQEVMLDELRRGPRRW